MTKPGAVEEQPAVTQPKAASGTGAEKRAERRRHARVTFPILVQFRYDPLDEYFSDYTTDISESGVFIITPAVRPPGTPIQLQFALKDGATILEITGRVVRVVEPGSRGPPGVGVEFSDLDEKVIAILRRIVDFHINEPVEYR